MPHLQQAKVPHDALAFTVADAVRVAGVGRSKLYQAIGSGALPAHKLGQRTLILAADLRTWLCGLPLVKPAPPVGLAVAAPEPSLTRQGPGAFSADAFTASPAPTRTAPAGLPGDGAVQRPR